MSDRGAGRWSEGVNGLSDLGSESAVKLVAEYHGVGGSYIWGGSCIRSWPLKTLWSQRSMQSIEKQLNMYSIARPMV